MLFTHFQNLLSIIFCLYYYCYCIIFSFTVVIVRQIGRDLWRSYNAAQSESQTRLQSLLPWIISVEEMYANTLLLFTKFPTVESTSISNTYSLFFFCNGQGKQNLKNKNSKTTQFICRNFPISNGGEGEELRVTLSKSVSQKSL